MFRSFAELLSVVILCGGRQTRMGHLVGHPKALLPFHGVPFLLLQILSLRFQGVQDIVLMAGGDPYITRMFDTSFWAGFGIRVLLDESESAQRLVSGSLVVTEISLRRQMGTAVATRRGIEAVRGEYVLVLNGDTILGINPLDILMKFIRYPSPIGFLVTRKSGVPHQGAVEVDVNTGLVIRVLEKEKFPGPRQGINGSILYASSTGAVIFNRQDTLELFPGNLEGADLWAHLIAMYAEQGLVRALEVRGWFLDFGTPDRARQARENQVQIFRMYMRRA